MQTRDFKGESLRKFDETATQYESHYMGQHSRQLYGKVAQAVLSLPHAAVLDVGCGKGHLLALLANDHLRLCGCDLSSEMIKYARERLGMQAELKVADSENLPWGAAQFEAITCTDSFHHYPNPTKVLQDMRRVLKPNGHLIIGEPWFPQPFRSLLNFSFRFSRGGDVKVYSQAEWAAILQSTGFALKHWEPIGFGAVILIAQVAG